MSDTMKVGQRLVELCRDGKNMDAINELYADGIVSVEAGGPPGQSRESNGKPAVVAKSEWWLANHTVHSGKVGNPLPNGDRFAVEFDYDITAKAGPMAGKRFNMHEVGVYTVANGKVVREEFYYSM